ncbi:hypothetical protein HY837_05390 [archaeon]|nr:hypothetical protein [archaeon]
MIDSLLGTENRIEIALGVENQTTRRELSFAIKDEYVLKALHTRGCRLLFLPEPLLWFLGYTTFKDKIPAGVLSDVAIKIEENGNSDEWLPVVLGMYKEKYLLQTTQRTNQNNSLGVKNRRRQLK